MAHIEDFGIPIAGGVEGILQPLIRNKPVLVFSVLTDDDNIFLSENVAGVPRPKMVDQDGEFYLAFRIKNERLTKLFNNLKALSGTVFLSPAVDIEVPGMVYDCYFVDHCRCSKIKEFGAVFTYKRIFWTFWEKHYKEAVQYGRWKQQQELDKPK